MSDIYLYAADEIDFDNIGLCGALMPNEAKFSEIANGNSTLTLTHPRDEYGKFALIERGMILKAAVPVRTTPEITNGQFVTKVYEYTVLNTATKEQRKIWNTRDKTKQKRKCLKVAAKNDPIVIVKTFDNANYFYKVKYTYQSKKKSKTVTGFIDPAALSQARVEKTIPATPAGMDSVADSWNVKDQLFRIENVEKTESEVNVTAHHISYDFMYNLTSYNFDGSKTLQEALDGVFGSCFEDHGFDAQTNIASTLTGFHYADKDPITAMMDPDIGLVPRFDGELVRDNYMFTILDHAGTNRGYRIEYGKNMTGISWQIDETSTAGALRPYGETKKGNKLYLAHSFIANDDYTSLTQVSGDDKGLVYSPRYYTYTNGTLTNTLSYTRIYAFQGDDCKATVGPNDDPEASDITEAMVRTRLKDQSLKALKDGADVPDVSISVDIKQLGNSVQYADFAELEKVFLFDTVLVYHRRMGILADAVVSAIEWDVIQDELVGITLGTIRDLSSSVASWQISQINGGKIMPSTIPGSAVMPGTISGEHIIAGDITAREIHAHTITADKMSAEVGEFATLVAQNLTAETMQAKYADIETLVAGTVTATDISAGQITSGFINSERIQAGSLDAKVLTAGTITSNLIKSGEITVDRLAGDYGSFNDLVVGNINAGDISASMINAQTISGSALETTFAGIADAQIGHAAVDQLDATGLRAAIADIGDARITHAVTDQLDTTGLKAAMADIGDARISHAITDQQDTIQLRATMADIGDARISHAITDQQDTIQLKATMANIADGKIALLNAKNIKVDDTLSAPYIIGQDGYFTGKINAGSIDAGEINAGLLKIRGEDGLFYKINVAANAAHEITAEEWDAEEAQDHLYGASIMDGTLEAVKIKAESITAEQISTGTIDVTRVTDEFGAGLIISSNQSITSLAGSIEADHSMIVENADSIASLVSLTSGHTSSIEQNADNITLALGRIKSAEDAIDQEKKWMTFDDDFLTIAKSNSPFSVNITDQSLNFNRGLNTVAYMNTERFGITDGEITHSLKIGRFTFVPQSNHNMSLVYTG